MALTYRTFYMNCQYFRHITKPVKWWNVEKCFPVRVLSSSICYNDHVQIFVDKNLFSPLTTKNVRHYSTQNCNPSPKEPPKKEGLYQRLKAMYRDYWYVVVPVHLFTSAIWFGSFYYIVRSGFDVIQLLQYMGVSETLVAPLRDSSAGYVALTFALYKIATPLRYAVTIGGTTFAIKRLTALGWIKPVPSKERLKEMYQAKKNDFQDRRQHYQTQMTEKRNQVLDEMKRYKEEMKNKVKKM